MDEAAFAALQTFLATTPPGQMLVGISASYAVLLLKNGRTWITRQSLGKPAQRRLNEVANIAFAALLVEARRAYPHNRDAHQEAVGQALVRLLDHPAVAERLLDDALVHARLDLPWLENQFEASGAAECLTNIPFDVGRAFGAWHGALAAALQHAAAGEPDLFPRWMVDNLALVHEHTRRIEEMAGRIEAKLNRLQLGPPATPECWRVPFLRNEQFVGRQQDLTDLHVALQDGAAVGIRRPAGLTGLGGVGKTQLAVEYCYRYREAYPSGIFWVNAAEDWLHAFADLGTFLDEGLAGKALDRQARAVVEHVAANPKTLLVLDNVLEPANLRAPVTPHLIPATLPCHVLFTTRRRDLAAFTPVELSALPMEPGLRLLLRNEARQAALDPTYPQHVDAVAIYNILGGLPLALEIAGAHLGSRPAKPIADYRDELLDRGALAVVDDPRGGVKDVDLGTRHAAAVAATLAEQWEGLADKNARLLLRVAGQFPEATVLPAARLGLLAGVSDRNEGFFGAPLDLALAELHNAALVEKLEDGRVRLHPLVRDFAAGCTDPAEIEPFRCECATNLLAAYRNFATLEDHCARRGMDALEADLLSALTLSTDESCVQSQISRFLHMLQRESHTVHDWDSETRPAHFAQQWLKRTLFERDALLEEQARRGAKATPGLAMNWINTHGSLMEERTLVGHSNLVAAAVLTSDGKSLISASADCTLKVWNLVTGQEERTLIGHTDVVFGVVVTPNGRQVVSASADNTLKVWDLATGQEERTLAGHSATVRAVAVMPDGQCVISASSDHTLKVWDLATGQEKQTLIGHSTTVSAVAVMPDGQRIVSASSDHTLKVWDLTTGQEERTFAGHDRGVSAVTITSDAQRIISGSHDGTVKVWDIATGQVEQTLVHGWLVCAVEVTPDGRWVISASSDARLKIWDLESGQERCTLSGHGSVVRSVAVTPDGNRVISASGDHTLKVWNLSKCIENQTLSEDRGRVMAVTATLDGKQVITAFTNSTLNSTLKVLDLTTGHVVKTLVRDGNHVTAAEATPDGQWMILASGSLMEKANHMLEVWNLMTDQEAWKLECGQTLQMPDGRVVSINGLATTPDNQLVISASADSTLKVWDLATGTEEYTLIGHDDWVAAIAVTPDGRRVISASLDNTLKVWILATGAEEMTLDGHDGWVNAVAVTPDSRWAVSAAADRTLKVWNLATGEVERTLIGHDSEVGAVAVTPDGRRVVSASYGDGALKVWDLATGQELASILLDATVSRVAVAPDGETIVAGDSAGNVYCLRYRGGLQ